jgi:Outer membrane protein beta-barrel domain
MRVSVRQAVAVSMFALALWAPAARAQTIPSSYNFLERSKGVGPFVGYMNVNTGRFGFGPSGGVLGGARWGVRLTGPVSFETLVGYMDGDRDVINPGREEGDRVVGKAPVQMVMLDARVKFSLTGDRTWHSVNPFLAFGGGAAFDIASVAAADLDLDAADRFDFGTSFFGTFGGGARWFLSDRFALRGDALFTLWKIKTPPGFSAPERGFPAVEQAEWVSGSALSISAVIRW